VNFISADANLSSGPPPMQVTLTGPEI